MSVEKKRILKLVEEGKLSVEEALTLLEGMTAEPTLGSQQQETLEPDLTTFAKEEEKKEGFDKKEEAFEKFQSAKEKIFEFVDTAFKKMKEIDIDLNFGKSIEIGHIFQQASSEFADLDIHVANGSVTIIPWDQPDVRVECQAKVYRVDSLEEARANFLQGIVFTIENNRLTFQTQHKWMKVEAKLYIPQADYELVRVRTFNGPISAENMKVKDLKLDAANGKIALEGIKGEKVKAETAIGKINVKKSFITEFDGETINGAIAFEGELDKGNLHTFNGNVNCVVKGNSCESLFLKATTGGIELFVPSELAVAGDLRSNLGGFNVKLDGIQIVEEKNEMVQKHLHFKTIREDDRVLQIFAETKTGSINIKPTESAF